MGNSFSPKFMPCQLEEVFCGNFIWRYHWNSKNSYLIKTSPPLNIKNICVHPLVKSLTFHIVFPQLQTFYRFFMNLWWYVIFHPGNLLLFLKLNPQPTFILTLIFCILFFWAKISPCWPLNQASGMLASLSKKLWIHVICILIECVYTFLVMITTIQKLVVDLKVKKKLLCLCWAWWSIFLPPFSVIVMKVWALI